jgi:hypothetical protein
MTSEGKIRLDRVARQAPASEPPPASGTGRSDVSERSPADARATEVRTLAAASAEDTRALRAWRQWLTSMATDAEAAMAAAIAYRDLDSEGREKWLESLEADALSVEVPTIALYAPLIAVEHDPTRRRRMLEALEGGEGAPEPSGRYRALTGRDSSGDRVCVVVLPLYLDFVQVLACAHDASGFVWVRHDPIVNAQNAPRAGDPLQGARLEATPLRSTIDELAAAVLAHQRSKRPMPEALSVIEELLDPADYALP